ncbi:MAG TPA: tetratricopeptide repeat protein [Vicinamibacterales bacterium]|nr:tetratricopeptide repeat protein [Vicinamibacterales bacterium]
MAFDRDDTLKKAEKLLRQGRLDAAIAEYERVVEDQPRDWNTANTLGDLYARAGHADKAAAQYLKIADHLTNEGFYPKAAALYKKILKFKADDEAAQLQLAELSAKQGLLADAKSHFTAVAQRRRSRGDQAGAAAIVVRLGTIDPSDIEARRAAARVLEQQGDSIAAAMRYRDLHADLIEKGRTEEAVDALREAVRLNPEDREGRIELARGAVAAGDFDAARAYLDRDTAGSDPALLLALANIELRAGDLDKARDILPQLIAIDRELRHRIVELAWSLAERSPAAAFVCIESAIEASAAASDYADAASLLQEFVTRVPGQIPALLKLVEICVDGGLEAPMYEAQAQLADAYLASGQAAEARVIAEDLVAREPWEPAHIERFRRALVMLKVSDPDTMIAERLSGHAPFMATDHFLTAPSGDAPPVADAQAAAEAPVQSAEPEAPPPAPVDAPPTGAPAPVAGPPAAPPSAAPTGGDEIDLTRLLGDLQGTPNMSTPPTPPNRDNLDEVFQDFRNEVSRQTGADDAAQQLKLARTYLEMGMSDEAIAAMQTAARSPRHRFEAAATLARLYRQRGDTAHAIEWFERAAEAPAPAAEDGRSLLYDLGALLESNGETSRALAVFLELQADAGDYRDVAARIDRLSRVQTGG